MQLYGMAKMCANYRATLPIAALMTMSLTAACTPVATNPALYSSGSQDPARQTLEAQVYGANATALYAQAQQAQLGVIGTQAAATSTAWADRQNAEATQAMQLTQVAETTQAAVATQQAVATQAAGETQSAQSTAIAFATQQAPSLELQAAQLRLEQQRVEQQIQIEQNNVWLAQIEDGFWAFFRIALAIGSLFLVALLLYWGYRLVRPIIRRLGTHHDPVTGRTTLFTDVNDTVRSIVPNQQYAPSMSMSRYGTELQGMAPAQMQETVTRMALVIEQLRSLKSAVRQNEWIVSRPEQELEGWGAPAPLPAPLPALPPALKDSHQGPVDYAIVEPNRMTNWVEEVETRLSQLEDDHDR